MAQLAKLQLASAPACPNCRNRVTDLDLDALVDGGDHQCLFCSHTMRVPRQIVERLLAEREAFLATQGPPPTLWMRFRRLLLGWLGVHPDRSSR
jgi:hypothetical protein